MRVLLSSASGYIGKYIKNSLISCGHTVETISRSKNHATYTWTDLNNNDIKGSFDVVIDMSGRNIFTGDWNEVVSSRKYACQSIVNWIVKQQTPPKLWLGPSAVGIYPYGKEKCWIENDINIENGYNINSTELTNMQMFVMDWERWQQLPLELRSHVSHVSFRFGVVLGENSEYIKNLNLLVKNHIAFQIESGTQIVPWVYIDDIVRAVDHCINLSQQKHISGAYNIVSPLSFTTSYIDIINAIAHISKTTQIFTKLPSTAQSFTRFCAQRFLKSYLKNELYDLVTKSQKVLPQRLLDEGFTFKNTNIDTVVSKSFKMR